MGENETFVAQSIAAGAPSVPNSTITQIHDFTANSLVSGSPVVSTSEIPSTTIGVNNIETGQPVVAATTATVVSNFNPMTLLQAHLQLALDHLFRIYLLIMS